jgi:Ca-activated chloride channel family protein
MIAYATRCSRFLFLGLMWFSSALFAQETELTYKQPLTRILFLFDGSQSMYGRWESGTKIEIARTLMNDMLDSLDRVPEKNFQLALRLYGHQYRYPPQVCDDTRLEVPFGEETIGKIKNRLKTLTPSGTTPIAYALQQSGNDFPKCDDCRNIIILITDGIEECDGDPCAVSQMLQQHGIVLKPFVIGVGLDEQFKKTFECVGDYYDASDENTFEQALGIVVSQALNNTTAQVNLLDRNGNPVETNVPFTLYNEVNGAPAVSYVHTMNGRGNPDTLFLDPLVPYRLVVHSIPPVIKHGIRLLPGIHNTIAADVPRGNLHLVVNGYQKEDLYCVVRKPGEDEILHVQRLNSMQKYLTGPYTLELLTLPRLKQEVRLVQNETTRVEIPTPGLATFYTRALVYGAVFVQRGDVLEWVVDLDSNLDRQSFNLLPGRYTVIYRSTRSNQSISTVTKSFVVESGRSVIINH